jgi:putative transposase
MSAKGNPYDNAYVESFFKTLKQEEVYLWQYETYLDAVTRIPCFISDVYNRKRLHSALGYRPPKEFENLLTENTSQKENNAKTLFVWSEGCISLWYNMFHER